MRTLIPLVCAGVLIAGCSDEKRETRTAFDAPRENQTMAPSREAPPPASGDVNARTYGDRSDEVGETGARPSSPVQVEPVPMEGQPGRPVPTTDHTATGTTTTTPSRASAPDRYPSDADNTRVNRRDRDMTMPTPVDQGGSDTDRAITAEIRRAVVGDGTLSFTAKNVKIITKDGNVVLRGPVKNEDERAAILAKATRVAGPGRVTNQLELAK